MQSDGAEKQQVVEHTPMQAELQGAESVNAPANMPANMPANSNVPVAMTPASAPGLRARFQEKMKTSGRDMFYGIHMAADTALLASGFFTGNMGRAMTGALGAARNLAWFPLRKMVRRSQADIVTSFAGAASNIPQLVTAASPHETIAVSMVLGAYTLRGATRFGRNMIEKYSTFDKVPVPHNEGIIERTVHHMKSKTKDAFNEESGSFLIKLPPLLLFGRALMQMSDGISRKDYSAICAGSLFLVAATGLFVFDNRNVNNGKKDPLQSSIPAAPMPPAFKK